MLLKIYLRQNERFAFAFGVVAVRCMEIQNAACNEVEILQTANWTFCAILDTNRTAFQVNRNFFSNCNHILDV